ncbi:MAG TPA: hypothetical protein VFL41_03215 [Gaiellaceae bacterium]|nr:hypothetical protein [Gaiellaceae bacterium]
MRIRVSDPGLVGDLLEYLQRCGYEAMPTSGTIVAASLEHSVPYEAARLELDLHLSDWQGRRPDASAVVLD